MWRRVGAGWSVGDVDGRRVCNHCGTWVKTYAYRYYPPGDPSYERCVGFAWCSECRVYSGNMVQVPRRRALVDLLDGLDDRERERLLRREAELIGYLDRKC
ncbi:hypothetical protein [Streptomyces sp. NPDC089919]|uniref:hypothetical protein n=1 Tax=Streptomyces sp. NPDC089919 TaxID=3155188 RepID=UPI00343887CF